MGAWAVARAGARLARADAAAGARRPAQADAFIAAVLPNVVLAEDARLWQQIIFGEALTLRGAGAAARRARPGPEFFRPPRPMRSRERPDLGALRTATGRKGAAFFMPLRAALTGRLHGPELAPLLAAMPAERVRARLLQFARAEPRPWPMLRIHNSMSGQKEHSGRSMPAAVGMYVCGVTVYDYCHVGHARCYVVFDVIHRWLRYRGYDVTYVRNITDIDDKIIRRAAENGETDRSADASASSRRCTRISRRSASSRPITSRAPPSYIPGIIAMIARLIERGYAYVGSTGDVLYAVAKFRHYGQLSGKRLEDLRAGARVEVDEAKRDPLDFVLWKRAKPGEPAWASPWGAGRPGLAHRVLGDGDGAARRAFRSARRRHGSEIPAPRERDRAVVRRERRQPFVNVWVHNGFVNARRREDVQVAGQLLHRARGAAAPAPSGGAARLSCSRVTIAGRSTTARCSC